MPLSPRQNSSGGDYSNSSPRSPGKSQSDPTDNEEQTHATPKSTKSPLGPSKTVKGLLIAAKRSSLAAGISKVYSNSPKQVKIKRKGSSKNNMKQVKPRKSHRAVAIVPSPSVSQAKDLAREALLST